MSKTNLNISIDEELKIRLALYKEMMIEYNDLVNKLINITNNLILPLARIPQHPLGVSLLDEFLNEFEKVRICVVFRNRPFIQNIIIKYIDIYLN